MHEQIFASPLIGLGLLQLMATMNLDGGAYNQGSATARSRRLASSNATPLVASEVRPLAPYPRSELLLTTVGNSHRTHDRM